MFTDTQTTIARLDGPARPGRQDRRRRLRDRLLVARLPAPVPGRHPEDRARVHRRLGRRSRRVGVRPRHRRARPDARPADRRRGDRGARPARAAARAWAASSARATCSRRPMPGEDDGRPPPAAGRPPASPARETGAAAALAARPVQPARLMFLLYAVVIGVVARPAPRRAGRGPRGAPDPLAGGRRGRPARPGGPVHARGGGARRRPRPADLRRVDAAGRWPPCCATRACRACRSSPPVRACNLVAIVANGGSMPASRARSR